MAGKPPGFNVNSPGDDKADILGADNLDIVRNIFAGRKPAALALDFGAEKITLLCRDEEAPQGWTSLAAADVGGDGFSDEIEAMRALAAGRDSACAVDLWLPADQVLNTHLQLNSPGLQGRAAAAKQALGERTGLTPDEINVDLAKAPGDVWAICAVEAKVVSEAQDYARRWGFAPNMATTRHADAAFASPPDLTGATDRKPAMVAAAAAAAAVAIVVVGALAWPTAEAPPPPAPGPERIAMAPAVALPAPAVAEGAVVAPTGESGGGVAVRQPTAPEPGPQKTAALADSESESDFAATILSPSQGSPDFLSVDFSLPQAEGVTPIYANVAYRAPSLGRITPSGEAAIRYFPDKEPEVGPPVLPLLTLGDGFESLTAAPSELGAFDLAALGPAPRALRTEDLIVESDQPAPPEQTPPPEQTAPPEQAATPEQTPPPAVEASEDDPDAPAPPAPATAADDAPEEAPRIIKNAPDPRQQPTEPEIAEEDEAPGPGSVAAAPSPGKRPDSIDMSPGPGAVAAAPSALTRPKSIKPRPKAVARNTSSAKTVRAPSRGKPTGRGLANAATLRDAIALDKTSLLGVFGTKDNRRALLRMADGRMKRVSQGEVIDGWVISRIQATSMRMTRGSEVRNLKLIR